MITFLLTVLTIYLPIAITAGGGVTGETVQPSVTVLPNTAIGYNHVFGYIIYGEVQNNTADNISLVRVFATRPNGEQQDAITQIGHLAAGEKGCFAVYTLSPIPWDDAALTVTYIDDARDRARAFTVEEAQQGTKDGHPVVAGTIRNNNGRPVRDVHVVATLYDADGKVIGCSGVTGSPRTIADGAVGSFYNRFDLYADRPVASYALAFDGITK